MRTEKKFNPKKNLILKNFNPKKKILYKRRRWFYVTMVVMDVCPAKGVLAETITSPHCRRNEINRKQLRTKARKIKTVTARATEIFENRKRKRQHLERDQCFQKNHFWADIESWKEDFWRKKTSEGWYRFEKSEAACAFLETSAKAAKKERQKKKTLTDPCEKRVWNYLVDPASSYMLVSKTKPCKCKYGPVTINGWHCERLITSVAFEAVLRPEVGKWITVEMLELIHAKSADWPFRRSEGAHLSVYCVGRAKACQRVLTLDNCERSPPSMRRRRIAQTSVLSTFVGTVPAYRGAHGWRGIRVRFRRGSPRNGCHFQGRQQARKLPTSQKSASER